MKGLAILMVVFGHTPILDATECTRFFYAFHVAVFFILSGVLQRPLQGEIGFWEFARAKAKRLMLPYGAYALAGFAIWYALRAHWTSADLNVPPGAAVLSYVIGQPNFNPPLWFFPSLFVCELMAFPFFKATFDWKALGGSVVMMGGLSYAIFLGYGSVWGIHGACLAMPFLIFGHKARGLLDLLSHKRLPLIVLTVPLLLLALWLSQKNVRVGIRNGVGGDLILFYGAALAGFFMLLTTFPAAPLLRAVSALGRASAHIFAAHYMVGIFLMHAGKTMARSLGLHDGLGQICFWVIFWLAWVGCVWVGVALFDYGKGRVIKNVDS